MDEWMVYIYNVLGGSCSSGLIIYRHRQTNPDPRWPMD